MRNMKQVLGIACCAATLMVSVGCGSEGGGSGSLSDEILQDRVASLLVNDVERIVINMIRPRWGSTPKFPSADANDSRCEQGSADVQVDADDPSNVSSGATIETLLLDCVRSTSESLGRAMTGFIALRGGNSENMNIQNIFIGGIEGDFLYVFEDPRFDPISDCTVSGNYDNDEINMTMDCGGYTASWTTEL